MVNLSKAVGEEKWMVFSPLTRIGRKFSRNAEDIINEFAEYFASNGRIPWQKVMNKL